MLLVSRVPEFPVEGVDGGPVLEADDAPEVNAAMSTEWRWLPSELMLWR